MPSVPQKRCSKCGDLKPAFEFYKDKHHRDGLQSRCKDCRREYVRQWRADNLEHTREKGRRWYADHLEYYKEYGRKWHAENRERARKRLRKWRAENRERYLDSVRRRRRGNPDRARAIGRDAEQRRRARKRGNGGSYTSAEWEALCAEHDHRCLCCGEHKPLTADHIVPVSKGGTSHISNIQPLCMRCNRKKWMRVIDYRANGDRVGRAALLEASKEPEQEKAQG